MGGYSVKDHNHLLLASQSILNFDFRRRGVGRPPLIYLVPHFFIKIAGTSQIRKGKSYNEKNKEDSGNNKYFHYYSPKTNNLERYGNAD